MKKLTGFSVMALAVFSMIACNETEAPRHETRVIAHRGYWKAEGSAQNSLTSLRKAAEIGVYGSEFDVHMTSDGVLIVNHDNDIDGKVIHLNPYSEFEDVTLANGEKLPTLREYLEEGKKHKDIKLILEIKSASNPEHETRCTEAIVDMVREMGLASRTEYIAFSLHVCKKLVRLTPDSDIAYLNGDVTPAGLNELGIGGFDYNLKKVKENPQWFDEARELKMFSNVWTVNKQEDMELIISYGSDFITTDQPELLQKVIAGGR